MLLMKDRSFLYELSAYLIYVKVGERCFLYDLRAYFIYVKVGERSLTNILVLNEQNGHASNRDDV